MKQSFRNPLAKALSEWFSRQLKRSRWQALCNYENDYYGDRHCRCEEQSRA